MSTAEGVAGRPTDGDPGDRPPRRESFIPLRRADLARLCADQSSRGSVEFYEFCQILLAHLHHEYLSVLDALKEAYAPFNPDRDTLRVDGGEGPERAAAELTRRFEDVLACANYTRLSQAELDRALGETSLIPLRTYVDFADYEEFAFYYRGESKEKIERRPLMKKTTAEIDTLERVAVLLRFKGADHFEAKKKKPKQLNFTPGKAYLYLYKNVPRQDLELLFPNVKVWMTWRDRLLFAGPLLAGLGPMVIKILPSVGLLAGLIALYVMGPEMARQLDFDETKHLALWPIMAAALSSSMLLGGFAVKQYLNYKNKKLHFLKRVTDTLFFKNLVSNRGVLMTIVDSAEEELGKEMVLAYHHLLERGPQTRRQLDELVETWLRDHCNRDIDFDVAKALDRLSRITGPGTGGVVAEVDGRWVASSLEDAKRALDEHWDDLFRFSSGAQRN